MSQVQRLGLSGYNMARKRARASMSMVMSILRGRCHEVDRGRRKHVKYSEQTLREAL